MHFESLVSNEREIEYLVFILIILICIQMLEESDQIPLVFYEQHVTIIQAG